MAHIQIRISDDEKKAVQAAFKKMGMTMSSGIKIFLRRVAAEKKMPFEIVETAFPRKNKQRIKAPKEEIKESVLPSELIEEEIETTASSEKEEKIKSANFNKWNLFEKHEIG